MRHNLSLYDMFIRVKSTSSAARHSVSYWTLRDTVDAKLFKAQLSRAAQQQQQQLAETSERASDTEMERAVMSISARAPSTVDSVAPARTGRQHDVVANSASQRYQRKGF